MIDLLIPVLGRPQNAQPLVDSIHHNTELPHTIIFLCSRGDTAQIDACKATGAVTWICKHDGYAPKINAGADLMMGSTPSEWVFLGADDLRFHPGWDTAALAKHRDTGALVIGTNDIGNPSVIAGNHATHSLVHRSYLEQGTIDEPDKLLHEYHHNFCDNELIETAKHRGQWAFAADSIVEHEHWLWRKGKDDATYAAGRVWYHADGREFRKRQRLWR